MFNNGFDDYGLLDSGALFMAFCRDIEKQFATTKRRTHGQDLDEYLVAFGGGYFFCPPGWTGKTTTWRAGCGEGLRGSP